MKAEFVKKLLEFWNTEVYPSGIARLEYKLEGADEWVYVYYKTGGKKRFCVTADSCKAILKDFIKFIDNHDDYRWLFD